MKPDMGDDSRAILNATIFLLIPDLMPESGKRRCDLRKRVEISRFF
jgi:hypothetical protein